jgi:hypothetical protein
LRKNFTAPPPFSYSLREPKEGSEKKKKKGKGFLR